MMNRIQDNYNSVVEFNDALQSARTKYHGLIGINIHAPDWDKRIKFHSKKLQEDIKLIASLWQFAVSNLVPELWKHWNYFVNYEKVVEDIKYISRPINTKKLDEVGGFKVAKEYGYFLVWLEHLPYAMAQDKEFNKLRPPAISALPMELHTVSAIKFPGHRPALDWQRYMQRDALDLIENITRGIILKLQNLGVTAQARNSLLGLYQDRKRVVADHLWENLIHKDSTLSMDFKELASIPDSIAKAFRLMEYVTNHKYAIELLKLTPHETISHTHTTAGISRVKYISPEMVAILKQSEERYGNYPRRTG